MHRSIDTTIVLASCFKINDGQIPSAGMKKKLFAICYQYFLNKELFFKSRTIHMSLTNSMDGIHTVKFLETTAREGQK